MVWNWNDTWQYVYSKEQPQTFSKEHPVCLKEAPLNLSETREEAAGVSLRPSRCQPRLSPRSACSARTHWSAQQEWFQTRRMGSPVLSPPTRALPRPPRCIAQVDVARRDVSCRLCCCCTRKARHSQLS